ncbi:MAG: SurA N-terminal domain-containing protein [bacterium]|nr:SurA N-terminal domain-containing protein [bacterium]
MLDFLRKNASSWLSKVILGIIALIFALYFGFSGGGPPAGGTAPVAKVNGENIPYGLFNQTVQNRMSIYQQMGTANQNPDLQKIVQSQVLQGLIANTLMAQEAHQLGLHITDVELAESIRNNPGFRQNGVFNEEFYLKQFKPYYERVNGQNYEYSLREDLLKDRFRQVLDQTNVVSAAQVQDTMAAQDTQLTISKLEVPFGESEGDLSKEEAKKIAQDWIAAQKEGKGGEDLLKKHELKAEAVEPKSLQALSAYFGAKGSLPIMLCLVELEPGEVCPEPFQVRKYILAVALKDKSLQETDEQQQDQMKQQLIRAKQGQILTGVTNFLTRQAKIETFLTP